MDYRDKPIIIIGVGHSGTRLLVEMLQRLGSDGGDYRNEWKENKFFLQLHQTMIEKMSNIEWTTALLSPEFVSSFQDDNVYHDYLLEEIQRGITTAYPNYKDAPWHWKCPISLLFLETWSKIYPQGYYLHIQRDSYAVTESILRRKQAPSVEAALALIDRYEERIEGFHAENYLRVSFEDIESEMDRMIRFLPLEPTQDQIDSARSIIKRDKPLWSSKRSIVQNLREYRIRRMIDAHKRRHP
ncbi:MAG: sulfotransferase [Candidatus Latescibacterota bacterium]